MKMKWELVNDPTTVESAEQLRYRRVPEFNRIERIGIRIMRAWNALMTPAQIMPKVHPWQHSDGSELKR